MTNEDCSKVPPPHLLKKFSEQARVDSQKRGHSGYCKTFAKLCIDWAFQEAAMDNLRVASAEVSGVEPNSKSSPNNLQIRSSDITPPPELVHQWREEPAFSVLSPCAMVSITNTKLQDIATRAAQWGADQELDACIDWIAVYQGLEHPELLIELLRAARRPKLPSLKEQALEALDEEQAELSIQNYKLIRAVLESLPNHE